jgi:alpha-L-fucosidase
MSKLTEDSPLPWNGQAEQQKPKRKGRRLLKLSKVNLEPNGALTALTRFKPFAVGRLHSPPGHWQKRRGGAYNGTVIFPVCDAMKTSDNKIFYWPGNTSHPVTAAWSDLVDAFVRHIEQRFGQTEIRLLRVQDVIDSYSPDILNFDDGAQFIFDDGGEGAPDLKVWLGIPDLAPQIMAYYYNKNVQAHGGRLEGVVDLKEVPEPVWGTLTRDFEFGIAEGLQDKPWQTEACIGNWHYRRSLFENHAYQRASSIIPLFVDIVSKNGNLLLSIPLPGHGEPDSDEISFLNELAEWQQVNSEAIIGTRPWKIYGEGPSTETRKTSTYHFSQLKFDHTMPRSSTSDTVPSTTNCWWCPRTM